MAIATIMVSAILGIVIYFTLNGMEMQSMNMMMAVASAPFHKGLPGKMEEDQIRLPFFTVQINQEGQWDTVGGDYFDLSNRDFMQEIVDLVTASQERTGELKDHNLRYLKHMTPMGQMIVFSDTTTETATRNNLLYTSSLIFMVAIVAFLGISILLSRWVIRPVEKAWDQQRQFVADASHELKTPLSVIMSNAELVANEDSTTEERNRFADNILSTSYQMRSLVENLLEMARVDDGAVMMKSEELDFSQLVEDAVLSFRLLYEEASMGLESRIHEGIRLKGSEQHLYQVMDVLLDNGLKYSTPAGTVQVELNSNHRSCTLSVTTPGEPISQEELQNIFKRFYRGDKARAMNGSYGLGLSIARNIVEAHGGKIHGESGAGYNRFVVQLPMN